MFKNGTSAWQLHECRLQTHGAQSQRSEQVYHISLPREVYHSSRVCVASEEVEQWALKTDGIIDRSGNANVSFKHYSPFSRVDISKRAA